jgi:hypothetical protein
MFAVQVHDEKVQNETVVASIYFADKLHLPPDGNGVIIAKRMQVNGGTNGGKATSSGKKWPQRLPLPIDMIETHDLEDNYNAIIMPADKVAKKNGDAFPTKYYLRQPTTELNSSETSPASDDEKELGNENKRHFPFGRFFSPVRRFLVTSRGKISRSIHSVAVVENANNTTENPSGNPSTNRLWRRRHARTLEEGIRRERSTEKEKKLSSLLNKASIDARKGHNRRYVERTLMGLFNAVAEEVEDLDVELSTIRQTPLWRKELKEVRINFSRLGFKPLRMGGSNMANEDEENDPKDTLFSLVECADEAFDRIDKDNSGTLDREEIAQALSMISVLETDKDSIEELASELVDLYDVNGDGVVDREEYQHMVEDMAKIRPKKSNDGEGPLNAVKKSMQSFSEGISKKAAAVASAASEKLRSKDQPTETWEKQMGSITLSDLKLDLRRLVFGGIPIIKRVSQGNALMQRASRNHLTIPFNCKRYPPVGR